MKYGCCPEHASCCSDVCDYDYPCDTWFERRRSTHRGRTVPPPEPPVKKRAIDIDIWGVRLVGTDGRVHARWKAPRDLVERLPFKFTLDVKREFTVDRVELLDGNEAVAYTWRPSPSNTKDLRPGDLYTFTLLGVD